MPDGNEKIKLLYDAVSEKYDVGSPEEFASKLADPEKLKAFYEGVGAEYELGTFNDFEAKIAPAVKKKESVSIGYGTPLEASSNGSKKNPSLASISQSTSTPPVQPITKQNQDFKLPDAAIVMAKNLDKLPKFDRQKTYDKAAENIIANVEPKTQALEQMKQSLQWMKTDVDEGKVSPQEFNAELQKFNDLSAEVNQDNNKLKILDKGYQAMQAIQDATTEQEKIDAKERYNGIGGFILEKADAVSAGAPAVLGMVVGIVPFAARSVMTVMSGLPAPAQNIVSNNVIKETGLSNFEEGAAKLFKESAKQSEEVNKKYEDNVVESFAKGDISGAVNQATTKFLESLLPSLAAASSGGAGILGFGAQEYYGGLKDRTDLTESQKIAMANINGSLEFAFENMGTKAVYNQVKNVLKKGGQEAAEKATKGFFEKVLTDGFGKYTPLTAPVQEFISEYATAMSQGIVTNTFDDANQKSIKELNKDAFEQGVIGAFGGSIMAAPTIPAILKTNKGKAVGEKVQVEITAIDQNLQQDIPESVADALLDQKQKITEKLNKEIIKEKSVFDSMPLEIQQQVNDISSKVDELKQSIESGQVSEENIPLIQNKIDENQKTIDEIYKQAEKEKITEPEQTTTNSDVPVNNTARTTTVEQQDEYKKRGFEQNDNGIWVHKGSHPKIKEILNGWIGKLFAANGGTHAGNIHKEESGIAGSLGNFNFKTGKVPFLDLVFGKDKTESDYFVTLSHEMGHNIFENLTQEERNIIEQNQELTDSARNHKENRDNEGKLENNASDAEESWSDYVSAFLANKIFGVSQLEFNAIPKNIIPILELNVKIPKKSTKNEIGSGQSAPNAPIEEKVSELKKKLKDQNAPQEIIDAIDNDVQLKDAFFADKRSILDAVTAAGTQNSNDKTITIGLLGKLIQSKKENDQTLLHEAVHAATVPIMWDINVHPENYTETQIKAVKELEDVAMDYYKNTSDAAKKLFPKLYGTKAIPEFIAEFISNPKFKEFVSKNNPTDKTDVPGYLWKNILETIGVKKSQANPEFIKNIENNLNEVFGAAKEKVISKENNANPEALKEGETTNTENDETKIRERPTLQSSREGSSEIGSSRNQEVRSEKDGENGTSGTQEVTAEQKAKFEANNQKAVELGFTNAPQALRSIEKRTGKKYDNFEDIPPNVLNQVAEERRSEGKTMKLSERILESDEVSDDIKKGLQKLGITYIPENINVNKQESKAYVDTFEDAGELNQAMQNVMNIQNGMTGISRGIIAAYIFSRYSKLARHSESIDEKHDYEVRAAEIARFSALQFKGAGQEINAAKVWKDMISHTPEGAIADLTNQYREQNNIIIERDIQNIRDARQLLEEYFKTDEGKKLLQNKVEEEIEKMGTNILGKERKQKVSNFFDNLIVKTKDKGYDATLGLPVIVWNGAIRTVKHSVLLGLNAQQAIKSGVDYVKKNYIGPWRQKEFELLMKEGINEGKPVRKIVVTENDKISLYKKWDKKFQRLKPESKRKLLANSLSELQKTGELSEQKLKDLYSEALGLPGLTDEAKLEIFNLIERINAAENAAEEYEKLFDNNASSKELRDAKNKYNKATRDARQANDELSDFFREKKNIWETFSLIMQGNLLTPISLVGNISSNIAFMPLRFMSAGVASSIDYVISQGAKYKLLNNIAKEHRTINLIESSKGAYTGFIAGIKEGVTDLKYGLSSEDIQNRDLSNKLHPLSSAIKLIEVYSGKNKKSIGEQLNLWSESVFGTSAEVMFRLLNLGDKPFRRMAEMGRAYEIAKEKGLKRQELSKFIEFPDEVSREEIEKAGDYATFQGENVANDIVQYTSKRVKEIPGIGNFAGLLLKSRIPYTKTPTNIISESLDFGIPPLSLGKALWYMKQGNRRKSIEYFAKSAVSSMIAYAAYQLVINGLITGGADDDNKKEKAAQYENIKPYSLNITGIKRMLSGGDPKPQKDDIWVNYIKTGGITGNILGMYADMGSEKTQEELLNLDIASAVWESFSSLVKTSIEQSFLTGVQETITAVSKGGNYADRMVTSMVNTLSSIAYPNTLAAISKSSDDYIREVNGNSLSEDLENMFKNKLFMGSKLRAKRNLWGKKIPNAPTGTNKYLYNLFDVGKIQSVDTDYFGYKLYDEWKKSKNADWLPSIPDQKLTIKKIHVNLTEEEYDQYLELVGNAREKLSESYVNSPNWEKDSEEKKIEILKNLYDAGLSIGKNALIKVSPRLFSIRNQ